MDPVGVIWFVGIVAVVAYTLGRAHGRLAEIEFQRDEDEDE